jgi:biopolymer transport protein ExbD
MSFAVATSDDAPMGDLNTTPLIDIMLVLLVMFIITMPLQTHAVQIDLPAPTIAPPPPERVDPVVNTLSVDAGGAIAWNGQRIDLTTLRTYLDRARVMTPEPELHFQPAPDARFDTVDRVLATVKRSAVSKFGFVGNERYYRYDR